MFNSPLEPIAVTGATGFIGKHLVCALVQGGARPTLLMRSRERDGWLSGLGESVKTGEIDLADDDSVRSALAAARPTTVLHLAGSRGRGRDESECTELNFRATVRMLEASMVAGVKRIVIVGTAEEYGNQPGPQHEALAAQPRTPYGISKARATEHALSLHASRGCPVVVVRPFSVYGPGQPDEMFIAEAVAAAVRDVEFRMSLGEQKRDLVFVDDVVRGLVAAASAAGIEGRVINIGSGECHRLRDAAELIWKLSGARAPLLIGAREAREEELYDTWADIALARKLLGWEPGVDIEVGLRRTIDVERGRGAAGSRAQTCQMM